MKYILNGLMALALVLMFTQCADNKSNGSTNNAPAAVSGPANMKIAYVEIDSLLTKYRFWNDLKEMMIKNQPEAARLAAVAGKVVKRIAV